MSNLKWEAIASEYDPLKAGSIDGTDTIPHDHGIVRAMQAEYKPNKLVIGDPKATLFVGRLNHQTSEATIKEIFSQFGDIKRLRLVRDIVTGFFRGYAFIEYYDKYDAAKAQRELNKTIIDNKEILVDTECERSLPGWIPRRLGGGFGGKKESGQLRFGGKDRPFLRPILPFDIRDRRDESDYRSSRDNSDYRSSRNYSDYRSSRDDSDYRSSRHDLDYRSSRHDSHYRSSRHDSDYLSSRDDSDHRSSRDDSDYRSSYRDYHSDDKHYDRHKSRKSSRDRN